ncbi:MAG: molybdenum cofactor biosynthesis protein MoaE [Bacteroidetes bacterium]|nr:molybdenum cofactor biosynthesis protein MoaE [Bacteroidota bacterium]MBL0097166.1 molybdenum cofactor biosynthesis protein MoaE [Bacteroidota bacterium]
MSEKKKKTMFVDGPITPAFIAEAILKHSANLEIGAHDIFLGQVRADEIKEKKVISILYSAYEPMAEDVVYEIREAIFEKYPLTCLHIYHSLGNVKAGEISLFIFTSSKHRKAAIDACSELVERVKAEVPVWGREILEDETYIWKENKEIPQN